MIEAPSRVYFLSLIRIFLLPLLLLICSLALFEQHSYSARAAPVYRVLFDNARTETAGNADWIISTSLFEGRSQLIVYHFMCTSTRKDKC